VVACLIRTIGHVILQTFPRAREVSSPRLFYPSTPFQPLNRSRLACTTINDPSQARSLLHSIGHGPASAWLKGRDPTWRSSRRVLFVASAKTALFEAAEFAGFSERALVGRPRRPERQGGSRPGIFLAAAPYTCELKRKHQSCEIECTKTPFLMKTLVHHAWHSSCPYRTMWAEARRVLCPALLHVVPLSLR